MLLLVETGTTKASTGRDRHKEKYAYAESGAVKVVIPA